MKTKYIYSIVALALGLTACDNYFDSKYLDNGDPQFTLAPTILYTLADADYKSISTLKANIALADSLDAALGDSTHQKALAQLAKTRRFDTIITPNKFIPAFLHNKYLQFDEGAVLKVTYNFFDGLPAYLDYFNQTIQYKLKNSNYKTIWGGDTDKPYLTAANEAQLVQFLPQVDDNELVGVAYSYAETVGDPIIEKEVLYIYEDGLLWKPYQNSNKPAFILPPTANGEVLKYLANEYPYARTTDSVIVMQYNNKSKSYDVIEYNFDGEQFVAIDGVNEERMSFGLSKDGWKELPIYYRQAVAGDGSQGEIVTQDFDLEEGITYIWMFDNLYGMKGTAYKSTAHVGEGWFILPPIFLKKSVNPALSFDHAMNYGPTPEAGRYEQATVWVSTDYDGDVRTATWTQLPWNEWDAEKETGFPDANSWTFYNSGFMDLSAWNNQTITIGFRYKSVMIGEEHQTCSTWEVKNILVNEP